MDTKFTPGPWIANRTRFGATVQKEDGDFRGLDLCEVSHNLPQKACSSCGSHPSSAIDEMMANANLMAESPNLYKVLVNARAVMQSVAPYMQIDESGKGPDCTDLFQAIIDVDYALTKARGEE